MKKTTKTAATRRIARLNKLLNTEARTLENLTAMNLADGGKTVRLTCDIIDTLKALIVIETRKLLD